MAASPARRPPSGAGAPGISTGCRSTPFAARYVGPGPDQEARHVHPPSRHCLAQDRPMHDTVEGGVGLGPPLQEVGHVLDLSSVAAKRSAVPAFLPSDEHGARGRPASTRREDLDWPLIAAAINGRTPTASGRFGSATAFSSRRTTSAAPLLAAWTRAGVPPAGGFTSTALARARSMPATFEAPAATIRALGPGRLPTARAGIPQESQDVRPDATAARSSISWRGRAPAAKQADDLQIPLARAT